MLERYLGEDASDLEMRLLSVGLYDDVYELITSLRRIERVEKAAERVLRRRYDLEINEIDLSISTLVTELRDRLRDIEELKGKEQRALVRELRERIISLRKDVERLGQVVSREVELSTSLVAEVLRRVPEADAELLFLSSRIEEAPLKLSIMPPNYLDMLLELALGSLPPQKVNEDVADKIAEVVRVASESESTSEDLVTLRDTLAILQFLANRYPQLVPGIVRYLDEIKAGIPLTR